MENTYGLFAINRWTFNQDPRYPDTISKEDHRIITTNLRIYNYFFTIFGYSPLRLYTGTIRMATATIALGDCSYSIFRSLKDEKTVNRFEVEAVITAVVQIFRGFAEAFLIYGRMINLTLDAICTPLNIYHHCKPLITPKENELEQHDAYFLP